MWGYLEFSCLFYTGSNLSPVTLNMQLKKVFFFHIECYEILMSY